MAQLIKGINDIATLHPEIAKQAYGWDPSTKTAGSGAKVDWQCPDYKDHIYDMRIDAKIGKKLGCPYCSNKRLLQGFNDLASVNPELAKEAYGWDPTQVLPRSGKKVLWQCPKDERHIYLSSPDNRARNSCPVCSGKHVIAGVNDLATTHPQIAEEAYGWDPRTKTAGSSAKVDWKCSKNHPTWNTSISSRTSSALPQCPYCAGKRAIPGETDLATLYPKIAQEASGWDPSLVLPFSHKYLTWQCPNEPHTYEESPAHRTRMGISCKYCSGKAVLAGFNDLKTKRPDIATQAHEWNPEEVVEFSNKVKDWKCPDCGHIWPASINDRTRLDGRETGCPKCAETGFNPDKTAWFYLMRKPEQQQIGITNNIKRRLDAHKNKGWEEVDRMGPFPGDLVSQTETIVKKWLKRNTKLVSGSTESWYSNKFEAISLHDLFRATKIKPLWARDLS